MWPKRRRAYHLIRTRPRFGDRGAFRATSQRLFEMQRRRSSPHTFENQIAAQKAMLEAELVGIGEGAAREVLLLKISELDRAMDMSKWLRPPPSKAAKTEP